MYPGQQPGYPAQGGGYPPQGGGYPPQGGGYPPSSQSAPGIGFNTGGSPYPPQAQAPYPPQGQAPYPPQGQPGYPPQQQQGYPSYPPQQNPYPSQPGAQGGYPPQQPGYPQANPAYPQGAPSYPQQGGQQGAYPSQGGAPSYPPQQGAPSYPPQQQGAQSYPAKSATPSYPSQQQMGGGGYPSGGAYPPQGAPNYMGQATNPAFQQQRPAGAQMSSAPAQISNMNRGQGTIKPWNGFNARADCEAVKKAMKGFGCDSKGILNILCQRSADQRQEIRRLFKTMYGKDMIKELVDELKGNLEDLIVALCLTPAEYDARSLRYAMEGAGTNESILIEILASRTNAEIHAIRNAYKFLYHRELEADLESETSYHFKRLCVALIQGGRDESGQVDPLRANQDARALQQAGEKKMGTDEATFNAIMCSQNFNQLRLVFQEYQKLTGHDLEKAVKGEFSGDIEDGLLAIVKVARNAPAFFAERLYLSMKGLGTKDHQLIRGVVSRAEVDMVQIKTEFQKAYGKTLESFIAGDTSGSYKDALLVLVRGN